MANVKKSRYIFALFLTVIIFSLGFLLGVFTSSMKVQYIEQLYKQQSADYESLQFQYVLLDNLKMTNNSQKCDVINAILENNLKLLGPAQEKIESYEESGDTNNEDYRIVKRKYMIANLRYWILAKKTKEMCNNDVVNILYFYTQDCDICKDQGFILTQLKKHLKDRLLVFPMDASIKEEPVVDILKKQYKITAYPTLVIEDKVYSGFMNKDELLNTICPLYKGNYSICNGYKK